LPVDACWLPPAAFDDPAADVVPLFCASLLELLVLCVDELADDDASCTLDVDDELDAVGAGVDVTAADAACCWLCAALFCWAMLCCKVCENGIAFAAAVVAALVDWVADEPNNEPIWERSDMGILSNRQNEWLSRASGARSR
jgi:hypothetical protein